MNSTRTKRELCGLLATVIVANCAWGDPCGMVPPIYMGPGTPIVRVGEQQTYVFYKNGIESFVIRPGYSGKVEEFGMLIPFPNPPALRKVSDNIFAHVAAAIDPPEVVIWAGGPEMMARGGASHVMDDEARPSRAMAKDELRVLNEEAVGMYEVAVLQAGSSTALKKWMEEHQYKFPKGMGSVCDQYVADQWCFVAVKTRVGEKSAVDPRPGQRKIAPGMAPGASFDGRVQAMGFRFKSAELVVPMRLSAFNEGDTRNIVYLLTDGPKSIRNIPEEFVVRQITGETLVKNLTDPLPLRIVNGDVADISPWEFRSLPARRDPTPHNGAAKALFASDIAAVRDGLMSLKHEEAEKELLRIGERLGLRGAEIDVLNHAVIAEDVEATTQSALEQMASMTLTVIDGAFPRDVLASQNLKFAEYQMPKAANNPQSYDATKMGPRKVEQQGKLIRGQLNIPKAIQQQLDQENSPDHSRLGRRNWIGSLIMATGLASAVVVCIVFGRGRRILMIGFVAIGLSMISQNILAQDLAESMEQLQGDGPHEKLVDRLVELSTNDPDVITRLAELADDRDAPMTARGWAIAAIGEIGGNSANAILKDLQAESRRSANNPPQDRVPPGALISPPHRSTQASKPRLIATWCGAARIRLADTPGQLIEDAKMVHSDPALLRPLRKRLLSLINASENVDVERLVKLSTEVFQLQSTLAPAIMAHGPEELTTMMMSSEDPQVRRHSAAYLATLGNKDKASVAQCVIDRLSFDAQADRVPWDRGPLFVPNIPWDQTESRELARTLVAWDIWAANRDDMDLQRQLHNNLRSIGRRAGMRIPNNQFTSPREWVLAWGQVAGKADTEELLQQTGTADDPAYRRILNRL